MKWAKRLAAGLSGALTPRGIGLPVVAVLMIAAGLLFGYLDLALLGAAGVLATAGSLLWVASRPPLEVRRQIYPTRVARGDPSTGVVRVRNKSRWRGATLVGYDRISGGDQALPPIRLAAQEETVATYQVPTRRRGIVDVGPLNIARRDPLGLVRVAWPYGGTARVWVHPRVYQLVHVPVGTNRSLDGVVDRVQHGSITFHALREYVPGDDLRHVHWRTSAHIGQLMVREHVDTSLPRIAVVLDDRPASYQGDGFEDAVDAAGSVITAIVSQGLTVDFHLVSGTFVEGGPDIGVQPMLDLLAEVQPTEGAQLSSALQRLRHRRRGDTAVLITGGGSQSTGRSASGTSASGTAGSGAAGMPAVASAADGDLDRAAALAEVYPTVVLGVLGATGRITGPRTGLPGVTVVAASTAAEFAQEWNGVARW